MTKTHLVAILATSTLILTACGSGSDDEAATVPTLPDTTESASTGVPGSAEGDEPPGEGLPLALREQGGSGVSGVVRLLSPEGGPLVVQIELRGASEVPHPAHIHEGTCVDIGDVVFPLEQVEGGLSETHIADLTLQQLQTEGPNAVNVHASEDDSETYIACVDIPQEAR